MSDLRRRNFITLLGGAAVAWPLAARAQQLERVRRIGVLIPLAADDPQSQRRMTAFVQTLQELGWTDGRNIRIDTRWTGGDTERMRRHAAELVALAPDVILASGGTVVGPLLEASRTMPIVFTLTVDPVGAGYVASLARPGGNATGFTGYEYGLGTKWLELLKEIAPRVARAAILRDASIPQGIGQFAVIQATSPSLGIGLRAVDLRNADEIERDVSAFAREGNGGLIVTASGSDHHTGGAAQTARSLLPTVFRRRRWLGFLRV
jgi:putative tryptophan/tyrosine transport system substrate-binding protein